MFLKADDISLAAPQQGWVLRQLRRSQLRKSEPDRAPSQSILDQTLKKTQSEGRRARHWMLRHIDLDLRAGDRLGIIGLNGAGKSTLLRVLAGVYEPTEGAVTHEGRLSALLSLGLGMDQAATGVENILAPSLLMGASYKEAREKIPEILEFAQLGDYAHMPIATYSSGMLSRLTFGIATAFNPDILMMDEWISTGDRQFFKRAEKRFQRMIANSGIIVLVTHRLELVRTLCNQAIMLHHGEIYAQGDPEHVIQEYISLAAKLEHVE